MEYSPLFEPFIELFIKGICYPIKQQIGYCIRPRAHITALTSATDDLRRTRDSINETIEAAERRREICTEEAKEWLLMVQTVEDDVNSLAHHICPWNCWSTYRLSKRVAKKRNKVMKLQNMVPSSIVAPRNDPVKEIPIAPMVVGQEPYIQMALSYLGDDTTGIIGIYGMGGVGKTTLLKSINNMIGRTMFDHVIFVVVSKTPDLMKLQQHIANEVGLILEDDESEMSRATAIFTFLKKRKFLLMLDDLWGLLDLVKVGIPQAQKSSSSENKQKVIFTTRSLEVCGKMQASKIMKLECLKWEEAWSLFKLKVGEDTMSNSRIQSLAEVVAGECDGLPLALITVGLTMSTKKMPAEWQHAVTLLKSSRWAEISDWDWTSEEEGVGFEEIECLTRLTAIGITVKDIPSLQRLLNSPNVSVHSLSIRELHGLTSLHLSPTILGSSKTGRLWNVILRGCDWLQELVMGDGVINSPAWSLSDLESLWLGDLPRLAKIVWSGVMPHACLPNLRVLTIVGCLCIKNVSWILQLPHLQELHIQSCIGMEQVIGHEASTSSSVTGGPTASFPSLKIIYLHELENLVSICDHTLAFPSLERILVYDCKVLKKLPLEVQSAKKMRVILGERKWWERLEWRNQSTNSFFHSYFKELPIGYEPNFWSLFELK